MFSIWKPMLSVKIPQPPRSVSISFSPTADPDMTSARRDDLGAQSMIESMYKEAGYTKPDIIYWNLHSKGSNFPVEFDKQGTALVSGFSPSILKSILGGKNMTPESILMDTINDERYSLITV